MTKSLIALLLLGLSLPLGCSAEEEPPDPLARREGFCESWAKNACNAKVVENCNAPSSDDCISAQSQFCLDLIPATYSSKQAKACLAAVKTAYADSDLTAEEIQVVRYLADPCDKLSKGNADEGDSCSSNDECNSAGGFLCVIKLGAAEGECHEPAEVPPGDACDGDDQICEDGYYCNGENCVVYKKIGGACEGDYQCSPEDHCVIPADAELGECTARLDLLEVCSSNDDCQSHYCVLESGATEGECASKVRLTVSEPLCDQLQ